MEFDHRKLFRDRVKPVVLNPVDKRRHNYARIPVCEPFCFGKNEILFVADLNLTTGAVYSVGDFWYGKNGIKQLNGVFRNTSSFTANFFNNKFRIKGDFTIRKDNNENNTGEVDSKTNNPAHLRIKPLAVGAKEAATVSSACILS